jgi:hypothetical protein
MSVNLKIREKLPPDSIVLDNESYDNSIIGVSLNGEVIYSVERMIDEYMVDNECSYEEAWDWISYNTLRGIAYIPCPRPMIVSEEV